MENIQENKLAKDATLREHFAGLAMQGFAAGETTHETIEDMAHYAVRWADALLKELEK